MCLYTKPFNLPYLYVGGKFFFPLVNCVSQGVSNIQSLARWAANIEMLALGDTGNSTEWQSVGEPFYARGKKIANTMELQQQ